MEKRKDDEYLLDDDDIEKYNKDGDKKFIIRATRFFLTYPQCPLDEKMFYDLLKDLLGSKNVGINLCVCSSEDHKSTEGKHIHVYLEVDKQIYTFDQLYFDIDYNGVIYHPNIQKPRNKIFVLKYVAGLTKKKKDDPKHIFCYGIDIDDYLQKRKKHRRYIFKDLLEKNISIKEAVEDNPSLLTIYKNLKTNINLYWADKSNVEFKGKRMCYWIYGDPGIGKSFSVRHLYPELYLKDMNKWWDGYVDQSIVLIDDYDSYVFSHYLKIWADNYIFNGEIKGGIVKCCYSILFITSNYQIDELFVNNSKFLNNNMLVSALKRRFKIIKANECIENGFFKFDENIIKEINAFIEK